MSGRKEEKREHKEQKSFLFINSFKQLFLKLFFTQPKWLLAILLKSVFTLTTVLGIKRNQNNLTPSRQRHFGLRRVQVKPTFLSFTIKLYIDFSKVKFKTHFSS